MVKRFFNALAIVLVIYTIGTAILITFLLLRSFGKIKITNPRNLPRLKPKMIIVANHPDTFDCMYEIFLVPALFLPQMFRHPLRFAPLLAPDARNFTNKLCWIWLRPFATPIVRGSNKKTGVKEAKEMLKAVKSGRIMMLFIEPGRTCTYGGRDFLYSESGRHWVRPPADLVGSAILSNPDTSVVTIWINNGNVPIHPGKRLFSLPNFSRGPGVVSIGETINHGSLNPCNRHQATIAVAKRLLARADQG